MSRLLLFSALNYLFSALNYLFSAPCYLKTAFLLANHNREIFLCILSGYHTVQALFLLMDISRNNLLGCRYFSIVLKNTKFDYYKLTEKSLQVSVPVH